MNKLDKNCDQVGQKRWTSWTKIVTKFDKNCDQVGQKV